MTRPGYLRFSRQSVRVTRRSPRVEQFVGELSTMLRAVLHGQPAAEAAQSAAVRLMGRKLDVQTPDPVVACYIDQNYASLLLLLAKYHGFEQAILANANAGGENVHRGLVLGALKACPSLVRTQSRDVVPLFLDFMHRDFYALHADELPEVHPDAVSPDSGRPHSSRVSHAGAGVASGVGGGLPAVDTPHPIGDLARLREAARQRTR